MEKLLELDEVVVRVKLPFSWRQKQVEDLLQAVASALRREHCEKHRAADLSLLDGSDEVCRASLLGAVFFHEDAQLSLSRREPAPNAVLRLPSETTRAVLGMADGARHRVVCRRFRDDAAPLVRAVRIDPDDSLDTCRAFPCCQILIARGRKDAENWPRLTALDVSGSTLDVAELARYLPASLRALDVSGCRVTTAALLALPRLDALDVSGSGADVAGVKSAYFAARGCRNQHAAPHQRLLAVDAIVDLDTLHRVEWLSIASKSLVDAHLDMLRHLPLRGLDLGGCFQITDAGLAALFRDHPPVVRRLESLALRGCELLTDTALDLIAHHLADPLHDLDLELCWLLTGALFIFDEEAR